jgi:polysaccharide export outer membrane protein
MIVAVSALVSAGCSPTWTASAEPWRTARLDKYSLPIDTETLQPGEGIQILLHTPELQTIPETVDDRGCVTLPIIGSIKIGGLASAKAEEVIEREYVRRKIFREGAIKVGIMPPLKVFYIEGHVKRAGPYQYSRKITIDMAVSMAGGPDEFAHDWTILLTRGGKKQKLDLRKDGNRLIEPGDIIEMPRGWM